MWSLFNFLITRLLKNRIWSSELFWSFDWERTNIPRINEELLIQGPFQQYLHTIPHLWYIHLKQKKNVMDNNVYFKLKIGTFHFCWLYLYPNIPFHPRRIDIDICPSFYKIISNQISFLWVVFCAHFVFTISIKVFILLICCCRFFRSKVVETE